MTEREIRIIETEDGSQSLYLPSLKETYHSTHGALQESKHVFVAAGLDFLVGKGSSNINVLEVGFGTGLNALLCLEYATQHSDVLLKYHTLEPYPLPRKIYEELKYADFLEDGIDSSQFQYLHESNWGVEISILKNFIFKKEKEQIQHYSTKVGYNLVFYDAFAPSKQSDVWQVEVLKKTYDLMILGGVLVTYCAQGQFKRDLKSIGFEIEVLEGPPGKKEMIRATK